MITESVNGVYFLNIQINEYTIGKMTREDRSTRPILGHHMTHIHAQSISIICELLDDWAYEYLITKLELFSFNLSNLKWKCQTLNKTIIHSRLHVMILRILFYSRCSSSLGPDGSICLRNDSVDQPSRKICPEIGHLDHRVGKASCHCSCNQAKFWTLQFFTSICDPRVFLGGAPWGWGAYLSIMHVLLPLDTLIVRK